jgi:hypothetical protein
MITSYPAFRASGRTFRSFLPFQFDGGYVVHRVVAEEVPKRFEQLNGGVLVNEDAHHAARP